jgi:hypothetical protein
MTLVLDYKALAIWRVLQRYIVPTDRLHQYQNEKFCASCILRISSKSWLELTQAKETAASSAAQHKLPLSNSHPPIPMLLGTP